MKTSRPVLFVLPLLLLVVTSARADAPPPPKWLMEITRVAYTDLGNHNASGDWPEKFIEDLAAAKVQMLFSRVHSGSGWQGLGWKSAYGDPTPAVKDRDATREVVALCHKHGIRYLGYYLIQREPDSLGEAHPDWKCVNSLGKPTSYYCTNNPEYRTLVRNRLVELVTDVGCDGIFLDMFHARSDQCYCAVCKAKFRKETGHEPPAKEDFDNPLWRQWTEFKYRSMEDAMLDFNRAMKAVNPEAALVANTWNAWCYLSRHNARNSIRVAENVDALLEEIGWYDSVDPSFFAFPAHHNFMCWHLAGLAKQKRAFMWSSPSFVRTQSLGATEATIRVMTMMTNGSVPAQSVPGRDVMAKYMAEIAARDEYFRADRLVPWCGMVVSEKTELWYGREDRQGRYIEGVYGAFQTMLEQHLPVSLVTDRELERGELEKHKVLLLPNCAAMSAAEMETIRKFVRDGGGLVATYETSRYDAEGKLRDTFGLADVLQAKAVGSMDLESITMSFSGKPENGARLHLPAAHRWSKDLPLTEMLVRSTTTGTPGTRMSSVPLNCRMLLTDPLDSAKSSMPLYVTTIDKATGNVAKDKRAGLIETTYGKGKVIYLPWDLSWMYFRYGHAHLARILELAVREAASAPPPVEVKAPSIVQSMVHVQGERLVVHLLNDISSLGRSQNVVKTSLYERREVIPIHGITVTIRGPRPGAVFLMPGKKPLSPVEAKDGWQVTLPPLDIHAMVVVEK